MDSEYPSRRTLADAYVHLIARSAELKNSRYRWRVAAIIGWCTVAALVTMALWS